LKALLTIGLTDKKGLCDNKMMTKEERLKLANEFILVIASCGRNFFEHNGVISTLELSTGGRVYFTDCLTHKRIYTHHRTMTWAGFSGNHTMKHLVDSLRDFIISGLTMKADYFQLEMDSRFKKPWRYGEDILILHDTAIKLGIAR